MLKSAENLLRVTLIMAILIAVKCKYQSFFLKLHNASGKFETRI